MPVDSTWKATQVMRWRRWLEDDGRELDAYQRELAEATVVGERVTLRGLRGPALAELHQALEDYTSALRAGAA